MLLADFKRLLVKLQTAVTVYFTSKQLLLFAYVRRSLWQYSMAEENPAAQRQTAVTAYFLGKQLLLFVFARQYLHSRFLISSDLTLNALSPRI